MRISQIILRVADIDQSLTFWVDAVGLNHSMTAGPFAFVTAGEVQLVLNEVENRPEDASLTEIVIEVDDVKLMYGELSRRGVPFEVEPRPVTSDGTRELWAAHFYDPDGHLASITSWVSLDPAGQ